MTWAMMIASNLSEASSRNAVEVHLQELHPGALEDPFALRRKTRVGPGHAAPQMRQEAAEVAVEAADVEDASISKPGQPEHQVGHHTPHVRRVDGPVLIDEPAVVLVGHEHPLDRVLDRRLPRPDLETNAVLRTSGHDAPTFRER